MAAKKQKAKAQVASSSRWPWIVTGFICSLFLAALMYLNQLDNQRKDILSLTNHDDADQQNIALKQPQFEFYNILAEDQPKVPVVKAKPIPVETKTDNKRYYLIQAASFTNERDADQLRAQLILAGFEVKIQQVQSQDKVYYRVILGPYNQKNIAAQDKSRLQDYQLDGLLLTRTG